MQVIALLLRSVARTGEAAVGEEDEMDYCLKLNKELPTDIRVLAWCTVPADFSARQAHAPPCSLPVWQLMLCCCTDSFPTGKFACSQGLHGWPSRALTGSEASLPHIVVEVQLC